MNRLSFFFYSDSDGVRHDTPACFKINEMCLNDFACKLTMRPMKKTWCYEKVECIYTVCNEKKGAHQIFS